MVDIGSYNYDPERYQQLADELYANYPEITLPPEYAYIIQEDLLRLLIRLARYKFVARLVKKTDSILEVGCGSGLGSIFLSQHCAHVTGMDVKTTEVEEARSINRRNNVEFKVGDFFESAAVQKYDVVAYRDDGRWHTQHLFLRISGPIEPGLTREMLRPARIGYADRQIFRSHTGFFHE
jgi:SAM-dependent methyltransferase